jgi:hypothetical protein
VIALGEATRRGEAPAVGDFGDGQPVADVRAERLGRRQAAEPPLRALVESVTARPVRAYMSEIGPEGPALETFVLDPT